MKKTIEEIAGDIEAAFPLYAGMAVAEYEDVGDIEKVSVLFRKAVEKILTEAGV